MTGSHRTLEQMVEELATRLRVPGVAVGIWHRGREEQVFWGVTSVENPLAVDADTLFQIGSTTKTFTATALAVLAERGDLDFEAPVRTYLPELRLQDAEAARTVTVRQLLNHTAGWEGDFFLDTGLGDDALARYVDAMTDLRQMLPPGRAASYNNAAVSLAGRVVERVTGERYEAALRSLVLGPLELDATCIDPLDVMTRRFAVGHVDGDGGPRVARRWNLPRSAAPAGGIVSTVGDQLAYARFHLGHGGDELLSRAAREALQRPTADFHRSELGDAVGTSWLLKRWGDGELVGHGGATNGQRSAFQLVPAEDFAVTVLTNANSGAQLDRDLLGWLLRERLGLDAGEPSEQPINADQGTLYTGVYATPSVCYRVSAAGERLRVEPAWTRAGEDRMRAFGGEVPPLPAFGVAMIGDDRYRVVDGSDQGRHGTFLREDGRVWSVDVGGRLALRDAG